MMRTFQQVQALLDLKRWRPATIGQFSLLDRSTLKNVLFRHFDAEDVAGLVQPYVEVVEAVERWIRERPEVAELVEVQSLTEIGHDFVARPFHIYMYALEGYDDPEEWDLVDVIPDELEPMRNRVRNHLTGDRTARNQIVEEVIAASLLGPSPATIMTHTTWLIVSPRVTADQLRRWAELAPNDE